MEDLRTCKVCEESKPVEAFPHRRKGRYYYTMKTCITCHRASERERARKYTEANRETIRSRERLDKSIRYERDPEYREKMKARSREYYRKNREKILARKRAKRCES